MIHYTTVYKLKKRQKRRKSRNGKREDSARGKKEKNKRNNEPVENGMFMIYTTEHI